MTQHLRRRSSLGQVNVGDTQVRSLGTQHEEVRPRRRGVRSSTGSGQRGLLDVFRRNSWLIPLPIVVPVLAVWYQSARFEPASWVNALVLLSYPIAGTEPLQYGKGPRDLAFVLFYAVVFTFIREFVMQMILKPLAFAAGLRSKHKVNRFLEQTYVMLYTGVSGPAGLYIMYHSDMWYFNTRAFYEGFPHRTHTLWFKVFYLLQASFWTQQAVVLLLQLEKRRRDFRELVFHHIVTLALIFLSYRFHFTHMGLAIYITMDTSDFFLALSKTLNYLNSILVAPFFVLFVGVWVYLRHYLNLIVMWSILTEFATVGPFELNWETEQYKCWISQVITFLLLLALQLVNIYWLVLILRILYRYVFHNVKEDVRSDDENSDDE